MPSSNLPFSCVRVSPNQPLPSTRRVVTGHNTEAKPVISRDSLIHGKQTQHGPWIQLLLSCESLPPDVNTTEDKELADTGLSNDGTIVRIVDFPPKSVGLLHRSITLDYIYVLKGEAVLVLDDGSRTVVKQDEAVVQQAIMHGWDNETDQWTNEGHHLPSATIYRAAPRDVVVAVQAVIWAFIRA